MKYALCGTILKDSSFIAMYKKVPLVFCVPFLFPFCHSFSFVSSKKKTENEKTKKTATWRHNLDQFVLIKPHLIKKKK